MRRCALLAAAAAGLACASIARADFTFGFTRLENTPDASHDVIELFAKNDGRGTGSKLVASDVTITGLDSTGSVGAPLLIKFVGAAPSSKADLTGTMAPVDANGNIVPDRSFVNILANDGNDDPTSYSVVSTTPINTPGNYHVPVTHFEVVGANLGGGINATTSNGGRGALIAVAVVEKGDFDRFEGSVGGDAGPPQPITFIPEPTALGVLALTGAGLLARRRAI